MVSTCLTCYGLGKGPDGRTCTAPGCNGNGHKLVGITIGPRPAQLNPATRPA